MEEMTVAARGMVFNALAEGSPQDPLVILLHGLPRNRWEWHHQIPAIAAAGFYAVAPDLRGYCDGARPQGAAAYDVTEFAEDVLAIADALGSVEPFHLIGTSIGASVVWQAAWTWPDRLASIACINNPHPLALLDVLESTSAGQQRDRMSYFANSSQEGREREIFERTLVNQALPEAETRPYVEAFASDEALHAVYHWYRANTDGASGPAESRMKDARPVSVPTMYVWPPGARNVSREAAENTARYVEGPYRFEVLEGVKNFVPQMAPDRVSQLLLGNLMDHR